MEQVYLHLPYSGRPSIVWIIHFLQIPAFVLSGENILQNSKVYSGVKIDEKIIAYPPCESDIKKGTETDEAY